MKKEEALRVVKMLVAGAPIDLAACQRDVAILGLDGAKDERGLREGMILGLIGGFALTDEDLAAVGRVCQNRSCDVHDCDDCGNIAAEYSGCFECGHNGYCHWRPME